MNTHANPCPDCDELPREEDAAGGLTYLYCQCGHNVTRVDPPVAVATWNQLVEYGLESNRRLAGCSQ